MMGGLQVMGATTPAGVIAWVCLATFGFGMWSANILALHADLFPSETMGTAMGATSMAASLGGAVFTYAVGRMVDTGGYAPVFGMVGLLVPLARLGQGHRFPKGRSDARGHELGGLDRHRPDASVQQEPPEGIPDVKMPECGKIIYSDDLIIKGGTQSSTHQIIGGPKAKELTPAKLKLTDLGNTSRSHMTNFINAAMGKEEDRSHINRVGYSHHCPARSGEGEFLGQYQSPVPTIVRCPAVFW